MLPADKQLHVASRLYQWSNDKEFEQRLLGTIRATKPPSDAATVQQLQLCLQSVANNSSAINSFDTRQQYFEKYPSLYGIELALFQVRNWLFLYNIDTRKTLQTLGGFSEYPVLSSKLANDTQALSALSTYAVNLLYLGKRLIEQDESQIFTQAVWGEILHNPAASDTLKVYFLTHCIIGETLFYARPIPTPGLATYRQWLRELEAELGTTERLSLDAQFELLVAHKLCGSTSVFAERIAQAASAAFDPNLGFIVDTSKPDKNTLETAEHRNILYVLAHTPCRLSPSDSQ